jgi:hypothetical protein
MQWGTRTTPPVFLKQATSGGTIDEKDGSTTLRYNTNTYNLISVQIAKATHTSWLVPTKSQPDNKEDLIFIFTSSAADPRILMIVVPIIRTGRARTDPLYLTALGATTEADAGKGPFSLEDCLPLRDYIKYTSCLNGYSTDAPTANAVMYVDVSGISVSPTLMDGIKRNLGFDFPTPVSYFMNKFSGSKIMTAETIGKVVSISSPFVTYEPPIVAEASTDNYKCMPLDMAQIQTSDMVGAKTLTEVLLPKAKEAKILDPGKLEKGISIALGVVMGIMFFGLGFYMIFTFIQGARGAASTVSGAAPTVTIFSKLYSLWPFLLVLIIGIAAGAAITVVTSKK